MMVQTLSAKADFFVKIFMRVPKSSLSVALERLIVRNARASQNFFFLSKEIFSSTECFNLIIKWSRAAIAQSLFSLRQGVPVCVLFLVCALTSPLNRDLIEASSQEAVRFGMSNRTSFMG